MNGTTAVTNYGWSSAAPSGLVRYLYPSIFRFIEELNPRSILDLGCGNGHMASVLAKKGYRIAAVDADAKGIELAKATSPALDFRCLHVGEPVPSDFREAPFDLVVASEVVEHLFIPRQLFDFARGCLVPGGVFLVTTPYHGWLKNTAISMLGHWDVHHAPEHDGGHIKFWSRRTLRNLAVQSGFREIRFVGCGRIPYLWKSMLVAYELGRS